MSSAKLRPGQIRYIECLGRQLVLWRGEDRQVRVMHAFCPHLGANLSFGQVKGNCIECAFHHWRFAGDGRATHIPYSDRIPRDVIAETFPVQEVHGQVYTYHSGRGGKQSYAKEPPYPVPRIPEVDEGTFVYRGAHEAGRVRMHILEFAENSVDRAHFQPVHGEMRFPWTQIRVPGVAIEHEADWCLDDDCDWKMYFLDTVVLRIFGRRIEALGAHARVSFYGPGCIVMFRISIPKLGDVVIYQTHLPLGPLEQQVAFRWFADRRIPRPLVWYVVGNWISQWQQDIEIWENKAYLSVPRLCRGDGPVFQLRRWYQQFLPDDAG